MKKIFVIIVTLIFLLLVYFTVYGFDDTGQTAYKYVYPSRSELAADESICHTRGLALNAHSALIVDNSTNHWLYAKRAQRQRPIASLTKLLTAMVYLDTHPNLDSVVYISARDCYESAKSHIYKGEGYIARDLLCAALMASDNRAARAIATASGIPRLKFIEKMNQKARRLGMMNTKIYEVTGLDERNVSTAADIAILARASMKYDLIKKATSRYTFRVKVQNKRRYKNFVNTNRLIRSRWKVLLGKTGFIMESDYCLGTVMRDKQGRELTVVVLGSPTNRVRFDVAAKLARYGFERAGRIEYAEVTGR